jgi:RNA polymerase-associated protein CTR9
LISLDQPCSNNIQYEAALSKERQNDPKILSYLGRTWYMRAKAERSISAFRTALDYAKQAVHIVPSDLGSQFNVAFLQFQIAQEMIRLEPSHKTLEEVNEATEGLQAAVVTLDNMAKAENPPFPRNDLISRANMGRNTMATQLERTRAKQAAHEDENASKLEQARKLREKEVARKEEEKRRVEEAAAQKRQRILEETERIAARDRELMEARGMDEDKRRDEDDDREARRAERKARGRGEGGKSGSKRKKKAAHDDSASEPGLTDDDDDEAPRSRRRTQSGTEGLSDEERPREKKKRKLQRKSEPAGKYKSAEFIDDDSDEGDAGAKTATAPATAGEESGEEGVAAAAAAAARPRKGRNVVDDEDDEDDGVAAPAAKANGDVAMSDDDE